MITRLNLNTFSKMRESLVTDTKGATHAVTMVQKVSIAIEHRLYKKFILIVVDTIGRFPVDRSSLFKRSTAMNKTLKQVLQIKEGLACSTNTGPVLFFSSYPTQNLASQDMRSSCMSTTKNFSCSLSPGRHLPFNNTLNYTANFNSIYSQTINNAQSSVFT